LIPTKYICGSCWLEFNSKQEYDAHYNRNHLKIVTSSPRITVKHEVLALLKKLRSDYILDENSITLALMDVLEEQSGIILDAGAN